MKKYLIALSLVVALMVTAMAVTVGAAPSETEAQRLNGISAQLQANPLDFSASTTQVCPVCGESVTWNVLPSITSQTKISGHYYLATSLTNGNRYAIASGTKACVYLNGQSIDSGSNCFEVAGTLNLMGSGNLTGYSTTYAYGSVIAVAWGGEANLMGGTLTAKTGSTTAALTVGNDSTVGVANIFNGTKITGSTNTGRSGGNVGVYKYGELNMYGGEISNGTAPSGGNIYAEITKGVNLYGGTISGGKATSTNGGNIRSYYAPINVAGAQITGGEAVGNGGSVFVEHANLTISSGSISGGTANYGGNIRIQDGSSLTMTGGTVSDGTASVQGGNINLGSSITANISGGTISGGSAADRGGSIYANSKSTLNISGKATITGGTSTGYNGGNMALEAATLSMTGGTVSNGTAKAGGNIYLFSGAKATISGGTVSGGTATTGHGGNINSNACGITLSGTGAITGGTSTAGNGGTLYMYNASLSVSGGTLTGGKAESGNGGAVMLEAANIFQTGGTITGGTAKNGGVVYAGGTTSSVVQISAGSLGGGTATVQGGNVFVAKGSLTVKGSGQITGGTSKFQGGSVYATVGTTVNVEGGSISGGSNNDYGGNIALEAATFKMSGGSVTGGSAVYAGNIYLFYGSSATISGGSVTDGTVSYYGGNIFVTNSSLSMTGGSVTGGNAASGGNLYIKSDAKSVSLENATISGGNATSIGGNVYTAGAMSATNCTFSEGEGYIRNIYHEAAVTLDGCTLTNDGGNTIRSAADLTLIDTVVNNSYIIQNTGTITLSGNTTVYGVLVDEVSEGHVAKLHVEGDFTGTASIDGLVKPSSPFYSGTLDETRYTSGGNFTGIVKVGDHQLQPWLRGKDGKLFVSGVKLVNANDDADVAWYLDAEAAINAYDALAEKTGYYVHLMCNADVVIPAGKTAYIDFNGETPANITVGEGAKLYGFDGTFGAGKLSWSTFNSTQLEKAFMAPDGVFYVAIPYGEGKMKTAAVEVAVTGISLRTSTAGMYYTATVNCHDTAKQYLTYGIAVQLDAAPAENFKATSLYTAETGLDGNTNGVLINNILTEGAASKERADREIYAVAYVEYEGVNLLSEAKAKSLTGLMGLVNENLDTFDDAKKDLIKGFYDTYAAQVGWELDAIANFVVPTKAEEV